MKKLLFFAGVVCICLMAAPAYAINWGALPNLLGNPGAETGDLTSWSAIGPWYATASQSQSTGTVYPHSGSYFFSAAQNPSQGATLTQIVDVSSYAALIDSGNAFYNAGLWYQTEYSDAIQAAVVLMDASSNSLDADISGEVGSSAWAFLGNIDNIPVGTRLIKIEINGLLRSGSYVNGFIDDTYLKIGGDVIPEPATLLLFGGGLLGLLKVRRKRGSV